MTEKWQDNGIYWRHLVSQGTSEWHQEKRRRLTSSLFGAIANPCFFRGEDDILALFEDRTHPPSQQARILSELGLMTEPKARQWYEKTFGYSVKEVGLIVPKWDRRIGTSLDGEVPPDGMIEIKCPQQIYRPLLQYVESRLNGWQPPPGYHQHIWDSHYDQMQGGMAIANKKWCDYVVYVPKHNQAYVERIYFNPDYWENFLYPKICQFMDKHPDIFGQR